MKTNSTFLPQLTPVSVGVAAAASFLVLLVCLTAGAAHSREKALRPAINRLRALETLDRADRARAETDIRSLGTNALPAILHLLQARHSTVERGLDLLSDHLPWFHFAPKSPTHQHHAALLACLVLGPDAAPVIPALSALLTDYPSIHIAMNLAAIGPAPIPAQCEKLAWPGEDTRYFAMIALRHLALQRAARLVDSGTNTSVEPFPGDCPWRPCPRCWVP